MRSLYTVYDFGDYDSSGNMGDPFIQLLSLTDPNEASADFHKLRGGSPNGTITYSAANVGTGNSATDTQSQSISRSQVGGSTKR